MFTHQRLALLKGMVGTGCGSPAYMFGVPDVLFGGLLNSSPLSSFSHTHSWSSQVLLKGEWILQRHSFSPLCSVIKFTDGNYYVLIFPNSISQDFRKINSNFFA